MKIKTSELTDKALDWAVAKCEGHLNNGVIYQAWVAAMRHPRWSPSTNWSQGGPIIEREGIATRQSKGKWYAMLSSDLGDGERAQWCEFTFRNVPRTASTGRRVRFTGPTPLIAAMRCYVTSKLGDEVEIPKELS